MASRALAMESIAVLDTLRSIANVPAFLVRLPAPAGDSKNAAAAAAAYTMLTHLFPSGRTALDDAFATALAGEPPGQARDEAIAFGKAVAEGVIATRAEDGSQAPSVSGNGTANWPPLGNGGQRPPTICRRSGRNGRT